MKAAAVGHASRPLRDIWAQFSPRRRFTLLALPWILMIPIVAKLSFTELARQHQAPLEEAADTVGTNASLTLVQEISDIVGDVRYVASLPSFDTIWQQGDLKPTIGAFQAFAVANPSYEQIRWIDEIGQERIRINHLPGTPVQVVPQAGLQDKSDRPYVIAANALAPGQVHVSPLDLNMEGGRLSVPHRPVLRVATPIVDLSGRRRGSIVLNLSAIELLDRFRATRTDHISTLELYLVDEQGRFLSAPDPQQAFSWQTRPDAPQFADLFRDVWQRANTGPEHSHYNNDDAWSLRRFALLRTADAAAPPRAWIVAVRIPSRYYNRPVLEVALGTSLIALAALTAAITSAWNVARTSHSRDQALRDLRHEREALHKSNTALQEALERQQLMQDELVRSAKLSSLGLLVAGVAHELNTPIGSARMTCSALVDATQSQLQASDQRADPARDLDRARDFLDRQLRGLQLIFKSLDRATHLVRTFRQLAVDRTTVENRRVTTEELFEELTQALRASDKQILARLRLDYPKNMSLLTHPGALGQVMENLVVNAQKHGYADGRDGVIKLTMRPPDHNGAVLVIVEDEGVGIPPENMSRVFDPFFTDKRGRGGTGLGLHLAHLLSTEILNAKLSVSSVPGHGARFELQLRNIAAAWKEDGA